MQICELNLYADDMEMRCSNADLSCTKCGLQKDLNSVQSWLCANHLSLSTSKFHVMLIDSHQKLQIHDFHVSIDGRPLFRVSSTKYLGLYVDEHLTWHKYTQ